MEIKTPINMKEVREGANQQEHFTMIAEALDRYSKSDQNFILWYLLQSYIEDMNDTIKANDDPKSVEQYIFWEKAVEQKKAAEGMREILYYSIF